MFEDQSNMVFLWSGTFKLVLQLVFSFFLGGVAFLHKIDDGWRIDVWDFNSLNMFPATSDPNLIMTSRRNVTKMMVSKG